MDLAKLRSIGDVHQLASAFGESYANLSKKLYGPTSTKNYRTFQIAKRSGGYRSIAAPRAWLKAVQREVLEALTEAYQPTRSAYGFVRKRSIVGGAYLHVGNRVVVNVDLADFFPTISFRRVRGLFLSPGFGLPYEVATVIAHICCRNGVLPQGAPTSPLISNFICSAMDRELAAVIGTAGGRYTRYCDDMAMSFQSVAIVDKLVMSKVAGAEVLNPAIENIITKHGFVVNPKKLKLRTRRERQEVTGIVVNERLNVRRSLVRLLHSQLHCVEQFGLSSAAARYFQLRKLIPSSTPEGAFAAALRGRILFVKMVRGSGDPIFAKLAKRFNAAGIYPRKISYYCRASSVADLHRAVWVVEVSYDDPVRGMQASQGTAFLLEGVGLVTCAHVVVSEQSKRPFAEIEVFRAGSLSRYRAYVASFDPGRDLAVLYIPGIRYSSDCDTRLAISSADELTGLPVQLVGFPSYRDGQSLFVSRTEIAATHGSMIEVGGQVVGGISGGPLLDSEFRVVGVLVRGIPGGGSKNEAIKAREAFSLSFLRQNLQILEEAPVPNSPNQVTLWSKVTRLLRTFLVLKSRGNGGG